ncbi:MAG: hypothetical protein M1376_08800 [Planctomycetes bacterium]|nr:hypothetical protein [Planctomycetota bacterium]
MSFLRVLVLGNPDATGDSEGDQLSVAVASGIFQTVVEGNPDLHNLAWYMKNKTLNCRRAVNIL